MGEFCDTAASVVLFVTALFSTLAESLVSW